jgi:pyruvate,water dikinase
MPKLVRIGAADELGISDPNLLGGKAAQQAAAAADGLPVKNSLVITTEVFPGVKWLETQARNPAALQSEAVRQYLEEHGVDLTEAIGFLSSNEFAVRSSATSEDLELASFAGSFVTKLNVPVDSVFSAIYAVWASTFTERVHQYLKDRGLADRWSDLKMAVLIQPMVSPLLSGVALSHPLGRPDSPYISVGVVRGLGEQLVSGEATPQSYLLERGTYAIVEQQDALDTGVIYESAGELGRTIEFLEVSRGVAQDIEFAIDAERNFTLLQNRAIAGRRPGLAQ